MTDDSRSAPAGSPGPAAVAARPLGAEPGPSARIGTRRRWPLFVGLAFAVVVVDQIAKALVTQSLAPGQSVDVIGDFIRIVYGQNNGALFGLFKDNALMFGIVSLLVIGLIVAYQARSTASLYLTVTLGLLLGGAIGNMLDRLRLKFVVDFVDAGIGSTRFYTFNIADSAISLAILLLFVAAIRPSLVDGVGRAERATMGSAAGNQDSDPETAPGVGPTGADDDWGDGLEPDDRPPAAGTAK